MRYKILMILLLVSLPAFAQVASNSTAPDFKIEHLKISAIKNSISFKMDNGWIIALDRIYAPPEAAAYLQRYLDVETTHTNLRETRYGTFAGNIFVNDENIRDKMVSDGYALAYPFDADEDQFKYLRSKELNAQQTGAGLWNKILQFHTPDTVKSDGTFQIVEGVVHDIQKGKGVIYINFGSDYRKDFTLFIAPKELKKFRDGTIDIMKLKGTQLRVRGWVYERNGPAMDLTAAQQIEILN